MGAGVAVAPATLYVGLGSNLGDRLGTLQAAARQLRDGAVPGTVLVRSSPVYETRPLGPSTAVYMNAAVELRTVAEPQALLAALQLLELRHGRTRRTRWEARTLDLDVQLPAGATLEIPALVPEMAVYTVDAPVGLNGEEVSAHILAVAAAGEPVRLTAGQSGVRLMVIGGEPLEAPRHIWWNFVSSRKDRIVQAASDWEAQAMGQVPGEVEWISLPERRFKA